MISGGAKVLLLYRFSMDALTLQAPTHAHDAPIWKFTPYLKKEMFTTCLSGSCEDVRGLRVECIQVRNHTLDEQDRAPWTNKRTQHQPGHEGTTDTPGTLSTTSSLHSRQAVRVQSYCTELPLRSLDPKLWPVPAHHPTSLHAVIEIPRPSIGCRKGSFLGAQRKMIMPWKPCAGRARLAAWQQLCIHKVIKAGGLKRCRRARILGAGGRQVLDPNVGSADSRRRGDGARQPATHPCSHDSVHCQEAPSHQADEPL